MKNNITHDARNRSIMSRRLDNEVLVSEEVNFLNLYDKCIVERESYLKNYLAYNEIIKYRYDFPYGCYVLFSRNGINNFKHIRGPKLDLSVEAFLDIAKALFHYNLALSEFLQNNGSKNKLEKCTQKLLFGKSLTKLETKCDDDFKHLIYKYYNDLNVRYNNMVKIAFDNYMELCMS